MCTPIPGSISLGCSSLSTSSARINEQDYLNVGKALNFIRLCCADMDFALRLHAPLRGEAARARASDAHVRLAGSERDGGRATSLNIGRLEYGREAELESVVLRASSLANARLLDLLMDKFQLRQHCYNTQILSKQGFFVNLMKQQALMTDILPAGPSNVKQVTTN